jgi:IrrE N-terminal-like domain
MLPRAEIDRMAMACSDIGAAVADPDGFVPIRSLLRQFGAELVLRPLLVEAMLVSQRGRWIVLLDAERSGVTQSAIDAESSRSALPVRARNTVVHELVHALAFKRTDDAIVWRESLGGAQTNPDWVKAVERETEKLSPLLLIPDKQLELRLRPFDSALTLAQLKSLQRTFGVSREVLINRLCRLKDNDPFSLLARDALVDLAIGTGTVGEGGSADLLGWPIFLNFDRNVVPSGLMELQRRRRMPAAEVFPGAMQVGEGRALPGLLSTAAGTGRIADIETMRVRIEVEQTQALSERRFLIVVSRPKEDWPLERRDRAAAIADAKGVATRTATGACYQVTEQ